MDSRKKQTKNQGNEYKRVVLDARVKVEQVRIILSWDFRATE
jgi:hypothetical protein